MANIDILEEEETKLECECSICGKVETYNLDKEEQKTLTQYRYEGRSMGYLQELFPKVPAWIRSGCIDQYSGGFCMCPECCGGVG